MESGDHVPSGVRAEEQAAVAQAELVVLVANHASRRAGTSVDAGRQHAGIVLMPMRRERILPRPPIGLPVSRPVGAEVACARALHQPGHAARHHLIVVVVLPEVAERIDGELVSVAKVVRHDCQARPVGLHPQSQPARPDPPIVAHQSALVLQVVRSAAGIETSPRESFSWNDPSRHAGRRCRC